MTEIDMKKWSKNHLVWAIFVCSTLLVTMQPLGFNLFCSENC